MSQLENLGRRVTVVMFGIITAFILWARIVATTGREFPLDVSAILVAGVFMITIMLSLGVYRFLGGEFDV